jgi:glycerol-3-phosphate acyltransferase PlsX
MRPVAIDAMGGDRAPSAIVKGAIDSLRSEPGLVALVGDSQKLENLVAHFQATDLIENQRLSIVHADTSIAMDEKPSTALRKRDSSMHVICDLVSRGEACGALSAGNSGAMMAIALINVGRLEGVIRPAIATLMPSKKGFSIVADAGANVECTPEMLLQFALFGSAFVRGVFGIKDPKVAVLSNGEEDSKGNDLTRASLELIRSHLPNTGYCEGRDIFSGEIDVAVCDGFTGNILLKTAEGTAKYFADSIKQNVSSGGLMSQVGALLMRNVFREVKKRMDAREYGAAPLLGLKAPVFIAHGNSDAYAISRAIHFVQKSDQGHVAALIEASIKRIEPST